MTEGKALLAGCTAASRIHGNCSNFGCHYSSCSHIDMAAAAIVASHGIADSIDAVVAVVALDLDIAGDGVVVAAHDVVVLTAHDAPVGVVVANEPSAGDIVAVVVVVVVVGVAHGLADHNYKFPFAWRKHSQ